MALVESISLDKPISTRSSADLTASSTFVVDSCCSKSAIFVKRSSTATRVGRY